MSKVDNDGLIKLSQDKIQDLMRDGYCFMKHPNGTIHKLTMDDLCFKEDEIGAFEKTALFDEMVRKATN